MGMTNKEKFKEVFGLEIDDASGCGLFDCTDRECKNCPVKDTKDWWNSEYRRVEAILKVDVVNMLKELKADIEMCVDGGEGAPLFEQGVDAAKCQVVDIIQQKIDALKGNEDGNK